MRVGEVVIVSIMAWRDDNGWQEIHLDAANAEGEHNRLRGGRSRRRRAVKRSGDGERGEKSEIRATRLSREGFSRKKF